MIDRACPPEAAWVGHRQVVDLLTEEDGLGDFL
jgi:hypothetical protein